MSTSLTHNSVLRTDTSFSWLSSVFNYIWDQLSLIYFSNVSTITTSRDQLINRENRGNVLKSRLSSIQLRIETDENIIIIIILQLRNCACVVSRSFFLVVIAHHSLPWIAVSLISFTSLITANSRWRTVSASDLEALQ